MVTWSNRQWNNAWFLPTTAMNRMRTNHSHPIFSLFVTIIIELEQNNRHPIMNLGWHVNCSSIASFPGHSPSSFWLLPVCKNGRGRPGPFYQVNDISVYLGRQRVSAQRSAFCACVLRFESGAVCFRFLNAWNFSSWDRNYKIRLHDLSFDWGPLPPLSTWVGLPPSFLHTANDQKLDGERPGNEAIGLQFMSS